MSNGKSNLGIAPVIGIILILALSGVLVTVLTNPEIIENLQKDVPYAVLDTDLKMEDVPTLIIINVGGNALPLDEITVIVHLHDQTEQYRQPFLYDDDGILSISEEIGVKLNMSLSKGDVLNVKVVHYPTESVIYDGEVVVEYETTQTTQTPTTQTPTPTPTNTPAPPNSSYLVLNKNTMTWYQTISKAISAAQNNHTIWVYPEYDKSEDVVVDKTLKLISLGNATIRGTVRIKAENVEVSGFEIHGRIYVYSNNATIKGNTIHANYYGIRVLSASGTAIKSNKIYDAIRAIYVYRGNVIVENNVITGSGSSYSGIYIYNSNGGSNQIIRNNQITTAKNGIAVYSSDNNIVEDNIISGGTEAGIYIYKNGNNSVTNNTISGSFYYSIRIYKGSGNNIVTSNSASGGKNGIKVRDSNGNAIRSNTVSNVAHRAIYAIGNNNAVENNEIDGGKGIFVSGSNNIIRNNRIDDCSMGMYIWGLSNSTIVSNQINSTGYGFYIVHNSNNNTIQNNVLSGNGKHTGILLHKSGDNDVISNTVANFTAGISAGGDNCSITFNRIENCGYGIKLYSSGNTVTSNTIIDVSYSAISTSHAKLNGIEDNTIINTRDGIILYHSDDTTVENNAMSGTGSGRGIRINDGRDNVISRNRVTGFGTGISIWVSSGSNLIYNNLFNNSRNVVVSGTNAWNVTKQAGTNILGGNYIGGNAWLKPDGSGYSQTCSDSDGDGICDVSYTINSKNTDYLPLSS